MKVKIITKRWWTPPWGKADGITLYPFIFLRRGTSKTLLRHELIHVWQIGTIGWWRFYWKYITNETFRSIMENLAYNQQSNPNFLPSELEKLVDETLVGKLHK
jgi:hypothetical protein